MAPNDHGFQTVGRSRKPKDPPKAATHHGTSPSSVTGQLAVYENKIRSILVQNDSTQDMQVGMTIKTLLTDMFELDHSLIIVSPLNKAKSFNDIKDCPKTKKEFLEFFEYKEFQKRNGKRPLRFTSS